MRVKNGMKFQKNASQMQVKIQIVFLSVFLNILTFFRELCVLDLFCILH